MTFHELPTASQIIAALIQRLGGGPITLTYEEVVAFQTRWPTQLLSSEDGIEITLTVAPDQAPTYFPSDDSLRKG